MCIICVDFNKGSLTIDEAFRNLREMKEVLPDEHYDEVVALILEQIEEIENEKNLSEKDEVSITQMITELEGDGQFDFGWDSDYTDEPVRASDDPWYLSDYED